MGKRFGGQAPTSTRSSTSSVAFDEIGEGSSLLATERHASMTTTERNVATSTEEEAGVITRNTLLSDAANLSKIGAILMWFSFTVAKQEVKDGPTKNREIRMIQKNLDNVPLRTLVVFSQGALNFRTLDVLIHLMNGKYGKAVKRLFQRRRSQDRRSSSRRSSRRLSKRLSRKTS